MGRPVKFERDAILDATLDRVAEQGLGGATITGVAADIGAPTGSLYHRFPSRDSLVGELWLRCAEGFQADFLEHLGDPDPRRAARAALAAAFSWCREHPREAALLLVHRREDLLGSGWPDDLRDRARLLADLARSGLSRYARRRFGSASGRALRRVQMALVDVPLAAARRDLEAGRVPDGEVEMLTIAAAEAVLSA